MITINGSMFGDEPTRRETCPDCRGTRYVWVDVRSPSSGEYENRRILCGLCRGSAVVTYTRR